MILWGIVCGALVGWCAGNFDQLGLVLGGLVGWPMGYALRRTVRREIAAALEGTITATEPRFPVAAPARPPETPFLDETQRPAARRRAELQSAARPAQQ